MTTTPTYPVLTSSEAAGARQFLWIHTSTDPVVTELVAAVPGYADARAAVARLAAYSPAAFTLPPDPKIAMRDALLVAIDRGEELPEMLVDVVPDSTDRREVWLMQGAAVAEAREELGRRLDTILGTAAGTVLAATTNELEQVVEQARDVADRGGRVLSADEAIAHDRIEDFQATSTLEAAYVALRGVQLHMVRANPRVQHLSGAPATAVWFVANPHQVDELERALGNGRGRDIEGDQVPAGFPTNWLTAEALWWFAENPEAKPWAPTERQLDDVQREAATERPDSPEGARRAARKQAAFETKLAMHRAMA